MNTGRNMAAERFSILWCATGRLQHRLTCSEVSESAALMNAVRRGQSLELRDGTVLAVIVTEYEDVV